VDQWLTHMTLVLAKYIEVATCRPFVLRSWVMTVYPRGRGSNVIYWYLINSETQEFIFRLRQG
jgi:hypothetical protein